MDDDWRLGGAEGQRWLTMAREAAKRRLDVGYEELARMQALARETIRFHRELSEEAVRVRDETQDLYYYLQQKLDDNYETISQLEKRVIETRVEMERECKRHALQLDALALERERLLGTAREQVVEAREALVRVQAECGSSESEQFSKGDPEERAASKQLRNDLIVACDAARERARAERDCLSRKRISAKEVARSVLVEAAEREVEASVRDTFGDGASIADKVLELHVAALDALSTSAKRLATLDAQDDALDASLISLRRAISLDRDTYESARKRIDGDGSERDQRSSHNNILAQLSRGSSSLRQRVSSDSRLKTALEAAAKARTKRQRAVASVRDIVERTAAIFDCVAVLLRRASEAAKLDADEADAARECLERHPLKAVVYAKHRWPKHAEGLEPRLKVALIARLARTTHAYRVSLRQLFATLPPKPTIHSLSSSALITVMQQLQQPCAHGGDDHSLVSAARGLSLLDAKAATIRNAAAASQPGLGARPTDDLHYSLPDSNISFRPGYPTLQQSLGDPLRPLSLQSGVLRVRSPLDLELPKLTCVAERARNRLSLSPRLRQRLQSCFQNSPTRRYSS